eukprot:3470763-Rhodomonas_salina.4
MEFATCLVLARLLPGTKLPDGGCRIPIPALHTTSTTLLQSSGPKTPPTTPLGYAICLRTCYAMPGIFTYELAMQCPVLIQLSAYAPALRCRVLTDRTMLPDPYERAVYVVY